MSMKRFVLCPLLVAAISFAAMGDVTLPNTSTIADIQAAIDAADAGAVITLEDGVYNFNQTLTVSKGITLTGSHRDSCLLVGDAATPLETALIIKNVDACVKNVTISNIVSTAWYNYYAVGVRIQSGRLTQSRVTGCKTTAGNRTGGVSMESTVGGKTDAAFMTHCIIDHNSATGMNDIGGIMFLSGKNGGTVENCLVWANSGVNAGGIGIVSPNAWQPVKIVNCTIVGNTASKQGGGLFHGADYIEAASGPWVVNTIISGNTAPDGTDIYFNSKEGNKTLTGFNCLCPTVVYGENPKTTDPLFVAPDEGNFQLQAGSPARNAGNNEKAASVLGCDLASAKDFYGLDRVLEDVIDIGCAEFMVDPNQPTCVITKDRDTYVDGDDVKLIAVVDGFGSAEDIAYSWLIQRAGESRPQERTGSEVTLESLAFGSYTVNLTASSVELGKSATATTFTFLVLPKTLYVTSTDNPSAEAPYGTPETAATSIADALAIAVEGATIMLDEGTHKVSNTVVIPAGVKITGKGWDKTSIYATQAIGGPLVRINGTAAALSKVTVEHSRMSANWTQYGSGVVIGSDGGTLADCRVTDCGGVGWRMFGAVSISSADALVIRCLIDGNEVSSTQSTCGGIYATAGRIENCVITNNVGAASTSFGNHYGSGLCLNGSVTALNCTILGNRMTEGSEGSGAHAESSHALFHNCIIDGNLSGDGVESNYRGSATSFAYCLSSETAPESSVGCVVGRPVFSATKPLVLAKNSPGRSAGSAVGYDQLLTGTDFFGNPRVKHITRDGVALIDIGATESKHLSGLVVILK